MWPQLPEILIIAWIVVATFGLLKLDELGELVWWIRSALDPSLESDDAPSAGGHSSRNESEQGGR